MVPDISPTTVALFQLEQFSTSCLQNLQPKTIIKRFCNAWHIMGGDGGVALLFMAQYGRHPLGGSKVMVGWKKSFTGHITDGLVEERTWYGTFGERSHLSGKSAGSAFSRISQVFWAASWQSAFPLLCNPLEKMSSFVSNGKKWLKLTKLQCGTLWAPWLRAPSRVCWAGKQQTRGAATFDFKS